MPDPANPGGTYRPVTFTNHDYEGNVTHVAVVKWTDPALPTCCNPDPPDAQTLMEVTTKYDQRHRPVARTIWLSARGVVDANDPPIAGDGGIPAGDGLTSCLAYDDKLDDAVGLSGTYATHLTGMGFGAGSDGYLAETTNPEGETSVTIHDGAGRIAKTINGLGNAWSRTYDAMASGISGAPGDLLSTTVTDPLGHGDTSYADGAGRTLAAKDALNFYILFQYDAHGNRTQLRDPNNTGEDCVYDELGRKTQCTDTHGKVTAWAYDRHGNQTGFTDARSKTETCAYDGRDRRTSCTDRLLGVTQYAYDANGNLITLTDAQSKTTTYTYDAKNLKIQEQFPGHSLPGNNEIVSYAYDAAGRLSGRTDQANDTITHAYDMAGRMVQKLFPDGNNHAFTYDGAGRVFTTSSSGVASLSFTYDDAGRVVTEVQGHHSVSYTYDNADRNIGITYPNGAVVTRGYTDRNELSSVQYTPAGGVAQNIITRTYDAGGRFTTTTYGNGLVETRTYRTDNLVETISIPGVTGFTYSYDANKNRTGETDAVLGNYSWSTGAGGYDDEDRLINWARSNGDAQSWNLSLVGDWNGWTVNGTPETRTHNDVHELTQRSATALTYDARGNLAGDGQRTFVWDYENRLTHWTFPFNNVSYGYDELGRCKYMETGGVPTTRVYAGSREIYEKWYAGNTLFIHGDYVDELVAQVKNGQLHYVHANALYSTAAVTDAAGAVHERYAYTPYGEPVVLAPDGVTVRTGNPFTLYLFTGRRIEPDRSLYYYRARYHDPELGRFIGRDPLGYDDGPTFTLTSVISRFRCSIRLACAGLISRLMLLFTSDLEPRACLTNPRGRSSQISAAVGVAPPRRISAPILLVVAPCPQPKSASARLAGDSSDRP